MKGHFSFGILCLGAVSFATPLDDFMTGAYNSGSFSAGSVSAWTTGAGAVGGIRYTDLTITNNPFGGDAKTRVITTPGILEVSTDTEVDTLFTLGYGYNTLSTTPASNPLNLNLSSTPLVNLDFRTNDLLQPVTVTLFTNGGASSYTRSMNILGGLSGPFVQTYTFDFSSDAASLTDVDGIRIDFDPAAGGDFSLSGINTVPEPMSIAAISIGAAALLRRKKK